VTSILPARTPLLALPDAPRVLLKREGDIPMCRSMKLRSAWTIVTEARLAPGATIVESTSGNMGMALAWVANQLGYHAVLVTDPKLSAWHREHMLSLGATLYGVEEKDETGGWLLTRLELVRKLRKQHPHWFCPDQYANGWNPLAFEQVGMEIYRALVGKFSYLFPIRTLWYFASVSTGGSLSGSAAALLRLLKPAVPFPVEQVRIVAVDVEGSTIFGRPPRTRYLNGIGSGLKELPNLRRHLITDVAIVTDVAGISTCHAMRRRHGDEWWLGGSSGAVLAAVQQFESRIDWEHDVVVALSPDHGSIYQSTIYDSAWLQERGLPWSLHDSHLADVGPGAA